MGHGSAIFTHGLPTLLRATTPTQSYSHTSDLEQNEDKLATPTALQALVSHVQPVQTVTSAGSAVHLNSSGSALPLTAFTLPRASVLAPGTSLTAVSRPSSAPPPLQTFAITPDGIPTAFIQPSQLQAILSQVHVSSDSGVPTQIQLANTSGGIFMLPSQKVTAAAIAPSQFQTYTVTPSSVMAAAKSAPGSREVFIPSSSSSPLSSPSTYSSPTLTALPAFTQSQAPVQPTIIGSNHIQAILTTLQAHGKLQGLHRVQISPTNSLPLTITLPGGASDDILRAQTLLVNQGHSD
jgi:hypothetical protein